MIRDIKEIRAEITRTDDEMAKLFEKRMQLASQVAAYKKSNSLPIYECKTGGRSAQKRGCTNQ